MVLGDRVLEVLRLSDRPLDDDQVAVLTPVTIASASGLPVEIDGADVALSVLAVCARPSPDHDRLLAEVLKLRWVAGTLTPRPRIVVGAGYPEAARLSGTRAGQALSDLGVSVVVVDLSC